MSKPSSPSAWSWSQCCSGCSGAKVEKQIILQDGFAPDSDEAILPPLTAPLVGSVRIPDDDGNNDEDTVDRLPADYVASARTLARHRGAVSAEPMTRHQHEKPAIKLSSKTEQQDAWIRKALLDQPFFSCLANDDLSTLITAFEEKVIDTKEHLIRQGEAGMEMYLLVSGKLDVFVQDAKLPFPGRSVSSYETVGTPVGMLALLHNAPRLASVVAKERCVLWRLEREIFKMVLQYAAYERRQGHMELLKHVKLLNSLTEFQIGEVADALQVHTYTQGAYVVRAGDPGDCFFMVDLGEASAQINGFDVRGYSRGGYFGELSLINDRPRAADIVASSQALRLVSLDRDSFKRILGDTVLSQDKPVVPAPAAVEAPPKSNTKKRVSFTGASIEEAEDKPKLKFRASGFVSKEQLQEVVDLSNQVKFDVEETSDEDKSSRAKRNTGFVSAELLQQMLADAMEENQELENKGVSFGGDVDLDKVQTGPRKRNTGFVKAELLEKVMEEASLHAEDGNRAVKFGAEEKEDAASGPKKRNTGFVSTAALQALISEGVDGGKPKDTRNSCGEIYIPDHIKHMTEED